MQRVGHLGNTKIFRFSPGAIFIARDSNPWPFKNYFTSVVRKQRIKWFELLMICIQISVYPNHAPSCLYMACLFLSHIPFYNGLCSEVCNVAIIGTIKNKNVSLGWKHSSLLSFCSVPSAQWHPERRTGPFLDFCLICLSLSLCISICLSTHVLLYSFFHLQSLYCFSPFLLPYFSIHLFISLCPYQASHHHHSFAISKLISCK